MAAFCDRSVSLAGREDAGGRFERVLKIKELHTITNDVVEAAQSTLVIGVT